MQCDSKSTKCRIGHYDFNQMGYYKIGRENKMKYGKNTQSIEMAMKFTNINQNYHPNDYAVKYMLFYKMGTIMRKLKMLHNFEEEKGEEKSVVGSKVFPDPSVDEYVVLYHTCWQPGVPEYVYKYKSTQ